MDQGLVVINTATVRASKTVSEELPVSAPHTADTVYPAPAVRFRKVATPDSRDLVVPGGVTVAVPDEQGLLPESVTMTMNPPLEARVMFVPVVISPVTTETLARDPVASLPAIKQVRVIVYVPAETSDRE
jgi:hypothetical protein